MADSPPCIPPGYRSLWAVSHFLELLFSETGQRSFKFEMIDLIKILASSDPITVINKSMNLAFYNRTLDSRGGCQERMMRWFNLNIWRNHHSLRAVCEGRNREARGRVGCKGTGRRQTNSLSPTGLRLRAPATEVTCPLARIVRALLLAIYWPSIDRAA
jgi:hypothetical protein